MLEKGKKAKHNTCRVLTTRLTDRVDFFLFEGTDRVSAMPLLRATIPVVATLHHILYVRAVRVTISSSSFSLRVCPVTRFVSFRLWGRYLCAFARFAAPSPPAPSFLCRSRRRPSRAPPPVETLGLSVNLTNYCPDGGDLTAPARSSSLPESID